MWKYEDIDSYCLCGNVKTLIAVIVLWKCEDTDSSYCLCGNVKTLIAVIVLWKCEDTDSSYCFVSFHYTCNPS